MGNFFENNISPDKYNLFYLIEIQLYCSWIKSSVEHACSSPLCAHSCSRVQSSPQVYTFGWHNTEQKFRRVAVWIVTGSVIHANRHGHTHTRTNSCRFELVYDPKLRWLPEYLSSNNIKAAAVKTYLIDHSEMPCSHVTRVVFINWNLLSCW